LYQTGDALALNSP